VTENACWDLFDRFYCISVRGREDRRATAREQFRRVGLAGRVEFVLVDKHPADPERGIFESHLLCMREGVRAGASAIVIFEDDVVFDRFRPETVQRAAAFLASDPGWKICHFGCMVKRSRATASGSVRAIRYRSLTHAYVIHRPFAERLSRASWRGVPYDDFLQTFREGAYIVRPTFAFQSDAPSDNDSRVRLESFRNLCGGLERLQKMNEFYHCHRTPVILAHAAAALGLLLWLLL